MRKCSLLFLTVLFIIIMVLSLTFHVSGQSTDVSYGGVGIKLYVLDLPDVTSQGVGDVNQTVQGVLDAAEVNRTTFVTDFPFAHGDLSLNISVSVVHDWTTYRALVESDSSFIIVNVHGETLPVPAGYSRGDWVDRIAEALAYRNATWVHTALYPFYYSYDELSGESLWGEAGFKEFMNFIGIENVTCSSHDEAEPIGMNLVTRDALHGGWEVDNFGMAEDGRPLKGSDFKNYTVMPIWGSSYTDMPGTVIRFYKPESANSYGYYVHIGTNNTFKGDGTPTLGDYWRGYVGTATALRIYGFRIAVEKWISDAEQAISEAEAEGRTIGLDTAKAYCQQAKNDGDSRYFVSALIDAKTAYDSALGANKPQLSTDAFMWVGVFALMIGFCVAGVTVRRRRNGKNRIDRK